MDKVSMPYLFSFPRYKIKCVINFLFRQLMSWTLRFILDQPLKQWLTGRKRGEDGNLKIWISWERKELFRWNKKHFSWFLKGYHLAKNKKNDKKIADISFKYKLCLWAEHKKIPASPNRISFQKFDKFS